MDYRAYTTDPKFVMQYAIKEENLSPTLRRLCFQSDSGQGEMRLVKAYQGVQIWNIDFHMNELDIRPLEAYHYLKLNYCISGSCEVPLPGERYVYIGPGVLSVDRNPPVGMMRLPLGEYVGLEIVIDLEELNRCGEPAAWTDCGVQADALSLLDKQGSYLAPAAREWAELAKRLYTEIQSGDATVEDCRFRLLQLMWMLKGQSAGAVTQSRTFLTLGQREVVLRAEELLTWDLRRRYSIEAVAAQVGVSPASLKKYFSIMFGMPISAYLRHKRMAVSKELLLSGEVRSIADIASEVGYENQGKFGAVFRRETGVTPLEFRRRYRSNTTTPKGEDL